jgi:hypothetical protein
MREHDNEYQKLLQKYHELKEKLHNLENDRTLFEHEIILDSGTAIYPSFSSEFFNCRNEKHKILEQLLDICAPIENNELKKITDIVSYICEFSKWGLYFLCLFNGNRDLKEHLLSKNIFYYENKKERLKRPLPKGMYEERNEFLKWLLNSCNFKDEFDLRKTAFSFCFDGEEYITINDLK